MIDKLTQIVRQAGRKKEIKLTVPKLKPLEAEFLERKVTRMVTGAYSDLTLP